jgi:hypothetical protein
MKKLSHEYGHIFGVDSKEYIRQWEERGEEENILKEFRANIGCIVNPEDIEKFEDDYDTIMDALFKKFSVERIKKVYSSLEIGRLFPGNEKKIKAFHLAFMREILNLKDINVNYFFTTINSKYLENNEVNIFGKYGRPTRTKNPIQFLNFINNYYNVLCAWKLTERTTLKNCTFIFDGMENIYPTEAFQKLTKYNNIRIVYSGDLTDPLLSTADILIKQLDLFLREDYKPLNENTINGIITYDNKIDPKNIYIHYIGNPDISKIKPLEDRVLRVNDLYEYIRRPIIFVSKGSLPGQRSTLENLPILKKIHDKAYGIQASIRIYDSKIDSGIIGKDPENSDYFISLTKESDEEFELLKRGGSNIIGLKIK